MTIIGLAAAKAVQSDPILLKINSGMEQEYNDNLFFTSENQESDWITTAKIEANAGYVTEKLDFGIKPLWRFYKYNDNSDLDDHDQLYRANFNYRFTPRLQVKSEGAFIIDNRRDDQVAETGVVFENVERKRWEATLSGDYLLSEKAALNVFGKYWNDDFENRRNSAGFNDVEIIGGGGMYTYLMSTFYKPTQARINAGYFNYDYDTAETDYYYLTMGASAEINETYTIIAEAGPRYTDSEFDTARRESIPGTPFSQTVTRREASSDWGWNGLLSLAYAGEKTNWLLMMSRDVTAASGERQTVEQTELRLDLNHRFSWEWSAHLRARYFFKESNRDNSDFGDIDEDTMLLHPRIRYRINNDWFLQGRYRYTWRDNNESNESWDRNQVFLECGYQLTLLD
jgi:hypothetical protein